MCLREDLRKEQVARDIVPAFDRRFMYYLGLLDLDMAVEKICVERKKSQCCKYQYQLEYELTLASFLSFSFTAHLRRPP